MCGKMMKQYSQLVIDESKVDYTGAAVLIVRLNGKKIGTIRIRGDRVFAWKPLGVEPRICPSKEFAIEWLVGDLA